MTGPTPAPRRIPVPAPVYALADAGALGATALPDAVAELARAGVEWIQIRAKDLPDEDLFILVESCFEALPDPAEVALWMNDRADVAALFPFAGLHLGQRDLPPGAARRVVGEKKWIGASTHDERELQRAVADPDVEVVAVGPVFPTTGKPDPEPVVGLDFVSKARRATDKMLVAIGGICPDNFASVLAAGADAVAVLSAVCRKDLGEIASSARLLLKEAGRAHSGLESAGGEGGGR